MQERGGSAYKNNNTDTDLKILANIWIHEIIYVI